MFKSFFRYRLLLSLLLAAILLKAFSLNPYWVEKYYTFGVYPYISQSLRALLGWIPFSIGDLLYIAASTFLLAKAYKLICLLVKRKTRQYLSWKLFRKYGAIVLVIYILFNVLWGLNYNRQGIAHQFGLKVEQYSPADLYELTAALQKQLNTYAAKADSLQRVPLTNNSTLFKEGVAAYKKAASEFPFLQYSQPSIKPSMLTYLGEYFGFTGYYNPFTAEAQLKTTVPVFTRPFIVCHEIGHQVGYAKENEANFSSYLAGRASDNVEFRYSIYWDMYGYAMRDLFIYNPLCFVELRKSEHAQVKKDNQTYRQYLLKSKNAVEPVMSLAYDRYLRMNNQPTGKESYNEVVQWLLAYMKKHGKEAL